jgi:hypothetical protein
MLARRRVSEEEVESSCRDLRLAPFADVLRNVNRELPDLYLREADVEKPEEVRLLWQNWLDNIEADAKPSYIPMHIHCCSIPTIGVRSESWALRIC